MPRNLLSARDLNKDEILAVFTRADELVGGMTASSIDPSRIAGLLFFESSTRTRMGFEVAAWRLGVKSVVMNEPKQNEHMGKAESLSDTIRTLNPMVSSFCIRYPDEDALDEVVGATDHPVINCGNGYDEHPTQALIDAYSMWKQFGSLDNLRITLLGQARYCRSAHSLVLLLSKFHGISIYEVTPQSLGMPDQYLDDYLKAQNTLTRPSDHVWGSEDVVYVTGFPPSNPAGKFSDQERAKYMVTTDVAEQFASKAVILTPLPRIDEIDTDVDEHPRAFYFQQNEWGLAVRMVILEQYCGYKL